MLPQGVVGKPIAISLKDLHKNGRSGCCSLRGRHSGRGSFLVRVGDECKGGYGQIISLWIADQLQKFEYGFTSTRFLGFDVYPDGCVSAKEFLRKERKGVYAIFGRTQVFLYASSARRTIFKSSREYPCLFFVNLNYTSYVNLNHSRFLGWRCENQY